MQPSAAMPHCAPVTQTFRLSSPLHSDIATAISVVAQVFAVPPSDLLRDTRGRAGVALARQIAMYLSHVVAGETLTEVGHHFCRDRTTVAHACRLVEARRDDPSFDRVLELLEWIVPVFATRETPDFAPAA
jgi:chromosomal replication initiation ATPase DnaA